MKKELVFTLIGIIFHTLVFSQVTESEKQLREQKAADSLLGWKFNGIGVISASQSSFTNWAAGGQNSTTGNALLNLYAGFKTKLASWDNILEMGYGLVHQGKEGQWVKSDDKIDFTSKYGRKVSDKLFYAALFNFKTQMSPGYNYPNDTVKISDFLAPAYSLVAIGLDYKPATSLSVFVAPITMRTTYVNSQALADKGVGGVTAGTYDEKGMLLTHGKKIKNEFGGYLKVVFRKDDVIKNVNIISKVDLFSNYLKNPQNMVVNGEMLIAMKVNKLLTVTIAANLIYDDSIKIPTGKDANGVEQYIGPRTQFKDVVGVGISYKFSK